MSTQNPFFSLLTTYPGGTPLKNPDTTQSKDIEIVADGPPGNPLEITDTHNGTLRVLTPPGSVYNKSGRYLHRELNMLDGGHTFGLRANSSSAPFHQWLLTVGAAVTPTIKEFFNSAGTFVPNGGTAWERSTGDSSARLKGTAAPTLQVRLTGGTAPVVTQAYSDGSWEATLSIGSPGTFVFRAEALYGDHPVSGPYAITKKVQQVPRIVAVYANNVLVAPGGLKLTQRSVTIEVEVEFGDGPANRQVRVEVSNKPAGYHFAGSIIVSGAGRRRVAAPPTVDVPHQLAINLGVYANDGELQASPVSIGIIGAE
jgi:hypothetical protein